MYGIELKLSGVQSHNSLGIDERHHAPLRRTFRKMRAQYHRFDPEVTLRLAVKAGTNTLGPRGHVRTKLAFRIDPAFAAVYAKRPRRSDRVAALNLAGREMAIIVEELRIQQALLSKLPPTTRYNIVPGEDVLVYKEEQKAWIGPHQVEKIM